MLIRNHTELEKRLRRFGTRLKRSREYGTAPRRGCVEGRCLTDQFWGEVLSVPPS